MRGKGGGKDIIKYGSDNDPRRRFVRSETFFLRGNLLPFIGEKSVKGVYGAVMAGKRNLYSSVKSRRKPRETSDVGKGKNRNCRRTLLRGGGRVTHETLGRKGRDCFFCLGKRNKAKVYNKKRKFSDLRKEGDNGEHPTNPK